MYTVLYAMGGPPIQKRPDFFVEQRPKNQRIVERVSLSVQQATFASRSAQIRPRSCFEVGSSRGDWAKHDLKGDLNLTNN